MISRVDAAFDWNDLDRAIATFARHVSHLPELFRQLAAAEEILALVPYHPEVESAGSITIENGSPFIFVRWRDDEGEVVPLFTSPARVDEGVQRAGAEPGKYSSGSLSGHDMFEILGAMNLRAVLNPHCATGSFTMPPDLMRDLASGRALQAQGITAPEQEQGTLLFIDPADYPTDLVQAVFEVVRQHREFRAIWIFGSPKPAAKPGLKRYQLLVLMEPRDDAVFHDFNVVSQNACRETAEVHLGLLPENDPEKLRHFMEQAPAPFYAAPGFEAKPVI